MEIRYHGNYGHGLRPGETWDMNCPSCKRERDEERQAEEQYENGMAADWPDERQLNDWNIHNDHADG